MATRMQQRRGTAAAWAAANPVLADGEIGFEHDTGVIKVGDGVTAWLALPAPYVTRSLVDAKGDIFVGTADNTVARLAAGTVGQRLTVQADGSLAWQAPSVDIPASIEDVKGDLIVGTGADTYARLGIGADGSLPYADSTAATGIAWKGTPALCVRQSVAVGIPTGAWTTLTWDTEDFDSDNAHAANAGTFVVPKAGLYLACAEILWSGVPSSGVRGLTLSGPGGHYGKELRAQTPGGWQTGMHVSQMRRFAVNDTISVQAFQDSGGTVTIDAGSGNESPRFEVAFIRP